MRTLIAVATVLALAGCAPTYMTKVIVRPTAPIPGPKELSVQGPQEEVSKLEDHLRRRGFRVKRYTVESKHTKKVSETEFTEYPDGPNYVAEIVQSRCTEDRYSRPYCIVRVDVIDSSKNETVLSMSTTGSHADMDGDALCERLSLYISNAWRTTNVLQGYDDN